MEVGSLSANRNLIIIVLLVLELACIPLFYFYKYVPMEDAIKEKEKIVEEKKRDVREIELTKRLLTETREEIVRLKADIARLEKFFPQEVFIPRVLVLIENLALATHVDINYIKPSSRRAPKPNANSKATAGARRAAPVPAAGNQKNQATKFDSNKEYAQSNVDFKIDGSFQNIYNFMNELSTFPKLVVVDHLSLTPQQSKEKSESESETGGSAETGREIEVGGYVKISANMPLTFYIQKQDTSKKLSLNNQQKEPIRRP